MWKRCTAGPSPARPEAAGKAAADKSGPGVDHVAYTYASLGDLVDTYSRLKKRGIEPYWPVRHGPTLSLYYRDPDGIRIGLSPLSTSFAEVVEGMDALRDAVERLDAFQ